MTAPDEVIVMAKTAETGNLTLHFQGGAAPAASAGFHLTIYGEKGQIRLSGENGFSQMITPRISISRAGSPFEELIVADNRFRTSITKGPASNVAELYFRLAADLKNGTQTAPDFETGIANHRVLHAIERSNSHTKWTAV